MILQESLNQLSGKLWIHDELAGLPTRETSACTDPKSPVMCGE
jgi:hypothetical protein